MKVGEIWIRKQSGFRYIIVEFGNSQWGEYVNTRNESGYGYTATIMKQEFLKTHEKTYED